ncbi:MAG TPA: RNA polymerase sigma-70 factor [Gemmatimonadaceae bacterium]|nr:RNA polymerase sigma-70 factor [Gemmatimonadaceae bacterium]
MASPDPAEPARPAPHDDASRGLHDLADLEALFHAHYAPLCEYVWSYVRSREAAEELVQGVFVRLWELQARGSSPELGVSYLYAAARNRAITQLRRERVARRFADATLAAHEGEPPTETALDTLEAMDLAAAADRAVAALPDRCRLIFLMSRQQGLSHGEIARALGVSLTTVETQISRALKRLRARLAPYLGVAIAVVHATSTALRILR